MIDPSLPGCGVNDVGSRRQGPLRVGKLCKITPAETIFGQGNHVHYDLKRSGKLSYAASFPRDMKDSGLQTYAIYTMQRF